MNINIGDYVSRNSYKNDIVFKVINIKDGKYILKGVELRLLADSEIIDLKKEAKPSDDFKISLDTISERGEYFYLPARILHIDTGIYLSNTT